MVFNTPKMLLHRLIFAGSPAHATRCDKFELPYPALTYNIQDGNLFGNDRAFPSKFDYGWFCSVQTAESETTERFPP